LSGQLEHCPLKGFVAAGTLPDAEIVELGKIEREQGDRFGNIGEDNVTDGGDILMLAAPVEIELEQTVGHQVPERFSREMDPALRCNQALGQIPLQLAAMSTAEQKSAIRRRKTRPSCYMSGGVA